MLSAAARSALIARSIPAVSARRAAFSMTAAARADGPSGAAGATASSKGFSDREKSEENRYIIERERENYKKAQAALKKQAEDLEKLEKEHAEKK